MCDCDKQVIIGERDRDFVAEEERKKEKREQEWQQ